MADGNNKFYYYIYNLQGDVIALADASTGKLVVTYTYDAWGKLVEFEDTTANSVGTQNPFRYRGYYYDTETKLYYLQTRYYDPDTGRFINADAFASTDISGVLSTNMFAYCENNPVMRSDPTGMFWGNLGKWFKNIGTKIKEYLTPSNVYGSVVSGSSVLTTALASSLNSAIKTSSRPQNVGAGTYAKQCKADLQSVSKFERGASKVLSAAAYGAALIDVGMGVYDNVNTGASPKKVISDAVVDAAFTGGSVWACGCNWIWVLCSWNGCRQSVD